MSDAPVLSYVQVRPLLRARQEAAQTALSSPDLGLSQAEFSLEAARLVLPDGQWLPWPEVEEIGEDETSCFVVRDDSAVKIRRFSEAFNRFYSLLPTEAAPTLQISGIPMHRIKDVTPDRDTRLKIKAAGPLRGRVLDTATGLGYTAIEAARSAEQVVTVELDPVVLEVARLNPWSRALFDNPRIDQFIGDSFDVVEGLDDESFSGIIHDPPTFALAGDLYSTAFYREAWRILKPRGHMFHYVGDPDSRSGRNVTRGVVRRLQEAGFRRVVRRPAAFGLVAYK